MRDESGVALVVTSLALLAILVVAGFAIDFGNSRQVAREAQGSTDAAALAAAQSLPPAGTVSTDPVFQKAAKFVAQNMFQTSAPSAVSTGCNTATKTCTYTLGTGASQVAVTVTTPYNGHADWVYVKACQATPSYFSKTFGGSAPTVCRQSVGRYVTGTTIASPGVIALKQGAGCIDFTLKGSPGSTLHVPGGSVVADCASNPPNSIAGSNAGIDAGAFYSVGQCANPADCIGPNGTPTYQISQPVPDPLAGIPIPTTATIPGLLTKTVAQYNALACLNGYYYVTGAGTVDMIPTCSGSTTSFTYIESADYGINLKSEVDETCTNTTTPANPYAGMCVFIARNNAASIDWNGNSKGLAHYGGTFYSSLGDIDWGGNIDVEVYGQVVASTYYLHGGGGPKNEGFVVHVPNGTTPIKLQADIGLQQ